MIHITAITTHNEIIDNIPLSRTEQPDIAWYWIDFFGAEMHETELLRDYFHFHPLAIEDCFQHMQRPKIDHYDGYRFYVLHALNPDTLEMEEVDIFQSDRFIVSFHLHESPGVSRVRERFFASPGLAKKGPGHITYMIMDQLVDEYFPVLYKIEDRLNEIEDSRTHKSYGTLMNEVFELRTDLLNLRRTIIPMRDLMYRILSLDHVKESRETKAYFSDIYDHLLKLAELIESNRDMTSDLRDSYVTLNSNRMNAIMMTLTIVSTIFIPLTFIAGVYGMNFDNMPELHWKYGYFIVLGVMAVLVAAMLFWFARKGWFNIFK
ncbi:magnesium/cobalt transporter CorA [Bacillus velezensis]|uniref:magnesium/cobalt transporter CorA n=1 Tax=Bacillus velezensis TaxID=492670 RepID=UPI003557B18B